MTALKKIGRKPNGMGVQTFMWMCEDNIVEVPFDKEYLFEQIQSPTYKAVIGNRGCGGIDSKLIEILSRTIKDGRVVSLIHKYL